MRTLYISDLDGTLLRSDQKTSGYTNETINRLVAQGMLFSYATARSYQTAHRVTAGLTAAFPLIVYNGAFIRDNASGALLLKNFFEKDAAEALVRELLSRDIFPLVYGFVGEEEKFSYLPERINRPTGDFVNSRNPGGRRDPRDRPVESIDRLLDGEIFYLVCIDAPDKLRPFYDKYREVFHCVYQKDLYSGEQWLEIMPREASKANAARQLAALLRCDAVVAFGDGRNDIDLFEAADQAYAVANAVPELKQIATGVIESNDQDGVARWLQAHCDFQ